MNIKLVIDGIQSELNDRLSYNGSDHVEAIEFVSKMYGFRYSLVSKLPAFWVAYVEFTVIYIRFKDVFTVRPK